MDRAIAQERITAILRELEEASGMLVADVGIERIDTMRVSDSKRRHVRRVSIQLEMPEEAPEPGKGWDL